MEGVSLSDRDRRLVKRLAMRGDAAPRIEEYSGGVRVQAKAGVGVIRFEMFEVRIEPKLEGGHLGLFRLIEFTSGLAAIRRSDGRPGLRFAGLSLLDFVIELLTARSEDILRAGLRADYVEREEDLPAIRGRFLYDRQELERFGLLDRVICRFDEQDHDILDNQLLAAALDLGGRLAEDPALRRRTRSLAALFGDICDPTRLDVEADRTRLVYDRLNRHYETAHQLALLLMDNVGPDDLLRAGEPRSCSFLINMNLLFERFVTRVAKEILDPQSFDVLAQTSSSAIVWREDRNVSYEDLVPDLLIRRREHPLQRLPVDAKYKLYGTDEVKVDTSDVAQVFLYSYAYAGPGAPLENVPSSVIVHPTRTTGEPGVLRLEIRRVAGSLRRARLRVIGIHILTLLDELDRGAGPALDALLTNLTDLLPEPATAAEA